MQKNKLYERGGILQIVSVDKIGFQTIDEIKMRFCFKYLDQNCIEYYPYFNQAIRWTLTPDENEVFTAFKNYIFK